MLLIGAFGYFFSLFALTNSVGGLIGAASALVLYIAWSFVRMLVTRRTREAAGYIALDSAVFAASFAYHVSWWFAAGVVLTMVWLYYAWQSGRRVAMNTVQVQVWDFSSGFLKSSFRAMVFLAIATYLSFVSAADISVSRAAIDSAVRGAGSGAGFETFQKMFGAEGDTGAREAALERVVGGLHEAANRFIAVIPPKFKTGLLVGIGIIVFVLVTSITGLIMPLIVFCAWGMVRLLLRMRFITIHSEKVDKEIYG